MSESYDFIIIGAGISGSATACRLARAGHKVVVIDRFGPASMASGWTLAGVRQSGRHPAELPLAKAAVEIWTDLDADLGAPTHYTRRGNLRLARSPAEYEQIRQMVVDQKAAGLDITFLPDNAAIRAVAPAVSPEIAGASLCASDGHADPHATVAAFVAAAERAGAVFRSGERVLRILTAGGRVTGVETDRGIVSGASVILAAGIFGNELLNPLDLDVPLNIGMVTVIRSAPVAPMLDQVIGVAGGDWAGRQEVTGRFRVTSGAQPWHGGMQMRRTEDGTRPAVLAPMDTLHEIIEKMRTYLPGSTAAPVEEIWAGLLDLTPDALPVLARAPGVEGLVIGMGFSGHGFCLGPITGRILADLALGEETGFDLAAFRYDRFNARSNQPDEALTLHG